MQFQNILIPTDFSGAAEPAVQHTLGLAARAGPDSPLACPARHGLSRNGRQAAICRVAQERQCDLIAMSTHGRTGRALDLIGSVADTVVRRAPCAVLIFRAALFAAACG